MTKAATVRVPEGMLTWARDRAHVDLKDAAEKIEHSEADLIGWEAGADTPLSALRTLAGLYNVPLSGFLLVKPKQEQSRSVDRRSQAGIAHPRTNAALAEALNRATGLQSLAEELHDALDVEPFIVVAESDDPEALAEQERGALGITVEQQLAWGTEGDALRNWRLAVERRGAYVLQIPLGDTDVRAFSVRGDPPVIVLDRNDWVRARIFSLAHELGHVVIGGSGICVPGAAHAFGVEKWCNEFADALLAPRGSFANDPDVARITAGEPPSDVILKRIGNRYKVSPAVVWYRLMQTKAISTAAFNAGWDDWSRWRPNPAAGGGGPTTAQAVVRDYGVMLPSLLLRATKAGVLTDADVSQYLRVRGDALNSIEGEIATRLAS
jgi:Zn-dependent peptidase ImmA (M78 family)